MPWVQHSFWLLEIQQAESSWFQTRKELSVEVRRLRKKIKCGACNIAFDKNYWTAAERKCASLPKRQQSKVLQPVESYLTTTLVEHFFHHFSLFWYKCLPASCSIFLIFLTRTQIQPFRTQKQPALHIWQIKFYSTGFNMQEVPAKRIHSKRHYNIYLPDMWDAIRLQKVQCHVHI